MPKANPSSHWRDLVSRLIKSEMSKRKIRYEELSQRLAELGTIQTADNLRNKVNRGILGADLLLQIIYVLKIRQVDYEALEQLLQDME